MSRSACRGSGRYEAAAVKIATLLLAAVILAGLSRQNPEAVAQLTAGTPVPLAECGPPEPVPAAASPVATPFVPEATATPPLPSADGTTALSVRLAVAKLAACWNDRRWDDLFALTSPALHAAWLGTPGTAPTASLFGALAAAGLATPITVESVLFVRADGRGLATAEVLWRQGNARHLSLWRFTGASGGWIVDGFEQLEPDVSAGAVGIAATIDAGTIALSRNAVVNPGAIAIDVTNRGASVTSIAVLSNPAGVDLGALLGGGAQSPTRGVSLLGYLPLAAGATGRLVLVDLAPGDYALVAGLEQAILGNQGAPAVTVLTVEPPVS